MASRFLFVGGHSAVDLVNTRPVLAGRSTELLADPRDLATWLGAAGLASPVEARTLARGWSGREGREVLARTIDYREILRSAFQAIADGRPFPARVVTATNRLLRSLYVRFALAEEGDVFALRTEAQIVDPDHALGILARSVADLLVTHDPSRLRRCANPECVLFFLDLTRSRTRRWCSMAICGNRAKQQSFQRRLRATSRARRPR
jgi:predicted RNA-binding Zn ribbon-like protein